MRDIRPTGEPAFPGPNGEKMIPVIVNGQKTAIPESILMRGASATPRLPTKRPPSVGMAGEAARAAGANAEPRLKPELFGAAQSIEGPQLNPAPSTPVTQSPLPQARPRPHPPMSQAVNPGPQRPNPRMDVPPTPQPSGPKVDQYGQEHLKTRVSGPELDPDGRMHQALNTIPGVEEAGSFVDRNINDPLIRVGNRVQERGRENLSEARRRLGEGDYTGAFSDAVTGGSQIASGFLSKIPAHFLNDPSGINRMEASIENSEGPLNQALAAAGVAANFIPFGGSAATGARYGRSRYLPRFAKHQMEEIWNSGYYVDDLGRIVPRTARESLPDSPPSIPPYKDAAEDRYLRRNRGAAPGRPPAGAASSLEEILGEGLSLYGDDLSIDLMQGEPRYIGEAGSFDLPPAARRRITDQRERPALLEDQRSGPRAEREAERAGVAASLPEEYSALDGFARRENLDSDYWDLVYKLIEQDSAGRAAANNPSGQVDLLSLIKRLNPDLSEEDAIELARRIARGDAPSPFDPRPSRFARETDDLINAERAAGMGAEVQRITNSYSDPAGRLRQAAELTPHQAAAITDLPAIPQQGIDDPQLSGWNAIREDDISRRMTDIRARASDYAPGVLPQTSYRPRPVTNNEVTSYVTGAADSVNVGDLMTAKLIRGAVQNGKVNIADLLARMDAVPTYKDVVTGESKTPILLAGDERSFVDSYSAGIIEGGLEAYGTPTLPAEEVAKLLFYAISRAEQAAASMSGSTANLTRTTAARISRDVDEFFQAPSPGSRGPYRRVQDQVKLGQQSTDAMKAWAQAVEENPRLPHEVTPREWLRQNGFAWPDNPAERRSLSQQLRAISDVGQTRPRDLD